MSIKIRKGKIEDLKEIASIEAACFPVNEAATEEALKGRLSVYPDYFYILEKDKKIVSFVNGMATDSPNLTDEMYENPYLHKDKGQWQMIFGVNTLPEYRKKGYAEKLINELIYDAKTQGKKGLSSLVKMYLSLTMRNLVLKMKEFPNLLMAELCGMK